MQKWLRRPAEVRLSWVVPTLLILGLLLNYNIAQAGPLQLEAFAPVVVHAGQRADYSKDALDLSFPPIDPSLADEILKDAGSQDEADDSAAPSEGLTATSTPLAAGQATPTPLLGGLPTLPSLPTLPPLLPTLPPVLPTVPAIVTKVVGGVGDVVGGAGDAAGDIVDDTVGAVETLVPVPVPCIPIPLIKSCN